MLRLFILSFLSFGILNASSYITPTPFSKHVKQKKAKKVSSSYHMPVITWADVMLSIDNQKLFPNGIKLVDDPIRQINNVIEGKTPFIRQTVGSGVMIVDALKKVGVDMILFHSISDSLGADVIVSKKEIKNLNYLKTMVKKGKKPVIAIQWGGPHMGWLIQLLDSLKLDIDDVTIKYTENLFGENSPESAIAEDKSIDIAFVISPSAATLISGEYALANLHLLTSTKVMSDAIKDVIYVRKDWAKNNSDRLKKIRDSYFASRENIMNNQLIKSSAKLLFGEGKQGIDDFIAMRDETRFHNKKRSNNFLYNSSNLMNFDRKTSQIISAYSKAGYISLKNLSIDKYNWDVKINKKAKITELDKKAKASVINKIQSLDLKGQGQDIFKKSISFKPNQSTFSTLAYKDEFEETIRLSATYGGAVIKIIGNVDPQLQRAWNKAVEFKKSHKTAKLMKVERYLKKVTGVNNNLQTMSIQRIKTERNSVQNAAKQTSKERANAVKSAIIKYAQKRNYNLDAARLIVLGEGGDNPVYEKPINKKQFLENIRVEFVITNYNAEISEFSEIQDF
jgi:hypothetical protein